MKMCRRTKKLSVTVTRDDVKMLSAQSLDLSPCQIEPYAKLRAVLRETHAVSGPGTKAVRAMLIGLPRPLLNQAILELGSS